MCVCSHPVLVSLWRGNDLDVCQQKDESASFWGDEKECYKGSRERLANAGRMHFAWMVKLFVDFNQVTDQFILWSDWGMCDGLTRLIGPSLRNEFTSGFSFSYLMKVISLAEPVSHLTHLGYYCQIMYPAFENEEASDFLMLIMLFRAISSWKWKKNHSEKS